METSGKEKANIGSTFKPCSIKMLPKEKWMEASTTAISINPINAPAFQQFKRAFPGIDLPKEYLAAVVTKMWPNHGVSLTVGFIDPQPADLRARILSHMNAWSSYCNVNFVETDRNAQVRISLANNGQGYWSYLGTDILHVDPNEQTMNLEGFTMATPDSEFFRVVRHETGHTLGFPHEHLRSEIVNKIDKKKAINYFAITQHWNKKEVENQVLTPIMQSALLATEEADVNSIMCYWLPGQIMNDNIEIPGGTNIDDQDAKFAALIYPKQVQNLNSQVKMNR